MNEVEEREWEAGSRERERERQLDLLRCQDCSPMIVEHKRYYNSGNDGG